MKWYGPITTVLLLITIDQDGWSRLYYNFKYLDAQITPNTLKLIFILRFSFFLYIMQLSHELGLTHWVGIPPL